MDSRIETVLVVGGSSGIGQGFATELHQRGKKVIVTGRRAEPLQRMAQKLKGIETRQFDITDFGKLEDHVKEILQTFPSLNTVILSAGMQKLTNFLDPNATTPESIQEEITTNLTAPVLLARLFMTHLTSIARSKPANLFIVSSSIGYIPLGFYPVYCSSKAALHAFCVSARSQIEFLPDAIKQNFSLTEIVPPYVDTPLDSAHRDAVIKMQGGPEKAFMPMSLQEYLDQVFPDLDKLGPDGRFQKEVGVGFGMAGVTAWREAFDPIYKGMGMNC